MESIGTVVKTDGKNAVVCVNRVSACGENCAHCKGGCTPTKAYAEAENCENAQVGDTVKIETETADVIKASLVLYFVPLVLSIISACIAYSFGTDAHFVVLASAFVFIVPFFVLKKFEKRITPISKITKVIRKA